ncbi:flagellar biosynthesis protein FliQ [Rosenbergiella sp. S61]|uniref:Flagellar biosynthetic protein FliQ n=1 Tax=Rosenbergiella gaditana TaxID=2726987 RepID=A0ABS5SVT1_9GAMM|nr:flagellar biosynthesis protein FliQ [Rosenbergiella gaditana]MBT0722878.1 flagellar biosynthesis protein FliQ [Rosenbergiella gaditana]
MTPEMITTLGQAAMKVALFLAAPPLLAALLTGLIISLLQAATQVNEQTLSFIPKIIAVVTTLMIAGPWMLTIMIEYIKTLLTTFPHWVG